ncbi:MAG: twin-arginine translocation signal domain-containing protein, partial [Planctomycetota bacterium]
MNIRKQTTDRRHFLKAGAMTFGALGMGSIAPSLQKSLAGDLPPGKKLLFIFLRGAMDAVQAVIPYGDQGRGSAKSYVQARPNIGIDPDDAHPLNNFCSLNPALQGDGATDPKLLDIFNGDVDGRGANLAFLHRIG